MLVTQDELKKIFYYNPEDGNLYWLVERTRTREHHSKRVRPPSHITRIGTIAGSISKTGYRDIGVSGRTYGAHRLAWLYVYGVYPYEVDHINRNKSDNRLSNLRECSKSQNNMNKQAYVCNETGVKGIRFDSSNNRYTAQIVSDGTRIQKAFSIKVYQTKELAFMEAKKWIDTIRIDLHKEFSCY